MMDLDDRELAIAMELAFLMLEETFGHLATHLTLDGATPDALIVLNARLEASLERVVGEYGQDLRAEIGAYALDRVRKVVLRAHSATEVARNSWDH